MGSRRDKLAAVVTDDDLAALIGRELLKSRRRRTRHDRRADGVLAEAAAFLDSLSIVDGDAS